MGRNNRYEMVKNGKSRKNRFPEPQKIERRNFVVDGNGAIIFSPVNTSSELPAGEYIPSSNRDGQGVLIPIQRRNRTKTETSITGGAPKLSSKGMEVLHSFSDSDNDEVGLEDEDLVDLERALDGLPPRSSSRESSNPFIPVHSYFPMENYSKGLKSAKENINRFLASEELYNRVKMDYRRSILLYGDPGTGKSQYIYQLSKELILKREAIVVRIEGSQALDSFFENVLTPISVYSNRLKVIVIEELADLCGSRNNVTRLLTMLDSLQLRDNVLFLITTNHPHRIPSNIVDRPSRLDLLCPIYNRDLDRNFVDAWFEFCMGREITDNDKQSGWYRETVGQLSPAYFKELFLYSQLHEISLDNAWSVIKERRNEIERDFDTPRSGIGF